MRMKQTLHMAASLSSLLLLACKPTVRQTQGENDTSRNQAEVSSSLIQHEDQAPKIVEAPKVNIEPPVSVEAQTTEPTAATGEVEKENPFENTQVKSYVVLDTPWEKYFCAEPKIMLLPAMPIDLETTLLEEQQHIKAVLDQSAAPGQSSDYAELQERLAILKSKIPSDSISEDDTICMRPRAYYDSYNLFEKKANSSSPDLVRSVQNIVHNCSLQDIGQQMNALDLLITTWKRRIANMSENGPEGDMRESNIVYINELEKYSTDFRELDGLVRKAQAKQSTRMNSHNDCLAQWKSFESTKLDPLEAHILQHSTTVSAQNNAYQLPRRYRGHVLYACEIGDRTLYFDLARERQEYHPFVLVDLSRMAD